MRDEALVAIAAVADRYNWGISVKRSSVELTSEERDQLWRIDAPWTDGTTVAVAMRAENWMLTKPSVRVELVDGHLQVVEGCRRFEVTFKDHWHGDKPCEGHGTLGIPDPFPFDRFVASVMTGGLKPVYIDGLIDPEDSPERRWGGWLWLLSNQADALIEWQDSVQPSLDADVSAAQPTFDLTLTHDSSRA